MYLNTGERYEATWLNGILQNYTTTLYDKNENIIYTDKFQR